MLITVQQHTKEPIKNRPSYGPLKRQHKEKDNGKTWEVPGGRSLLKLGSVSSIGGAHFPTPSPPPPAGPV